MPERSKGLGPGDTLGRYRILQLLGSGAMGDVYLAEDPQIERRLAIKTVRVQGGTGEIEERKERLLREAKAAGRLIHPNVVTLFDAGEDQGLVFLAFEYVDGQDLSDTLKAGTMDLSSSLKLIKQAASALATAHRNQIIHRDIKPANILVTPEGNAKLADFGIAKVAGQSTELTTTGSVVGSPHYMSPEQIKGEPLDGRSDIFSLGTVLYEMLTRARAFSGDTITTLVYQILHETPEDVAHHRPDLPRSVCLLVRRMMAKEREHRFATAEEVVDAIEQIELELSGLLPTPDSEEPTRMVQTQDPVQAPPPPPAVATAPEPKTSPTSTTPQQTTKAVPVVLLVLAAAGFFVLVLVVGVWMGWRWLQARSEGASEPEIAEVLSEEAGAAEEQTQPPAIELEGTAAESNQPTETDLTAAEEVETAPQPPTTSIAVREHQPRATTTILRPSTTGPEVTTRRGEEPRAANVTPKPIEPKPEPTADVPKEEASSTEESETEEPPSLPALRTDARRTTTLSLSFQVTPEDAFVLFRGPRDERFIQIGRAEEFDTSKRRGRPFDLPGPGNYLVMLRAEGMEDYILFVTASSSGSSQPVSVALRQAGAAARTYRVREAVAFSGAPRRARLLVDGKPAGSPADYDGRSRWLELKPGRHRVTVVNRQERRFFDIEVTPQASDGRLEIELGMR